MTIYVKITKTKYKCYEGEKVPYPSPKRVVGCCETMVGTECELAPEQSAENESE